MEPFVVGFDLGKEYSQICYWQPSEGEPVSLSVVPGGQKYRIPTENLELFLKKALRLLKPYGKVHEAAALVFSVEDMGEELPNQIKKTAMQMIGIPESRIYVQTHNESFCAYVLNQPKEIWRHHAVLFAYEGETVKGKALNINTRTTPFLTRVEEEKEWERPLCGLQPEEKDEVFSDLIQAVFVRRPVSSVYLVGEGFEEQWYGESLKILCNGRRVFAGNNLYAKGACYRAARAAGFLEAGNYVFLGAGKISYNVGLKAPGLGKNSVYTLLDAGESWYEAKAECEVLLCDEPVVEFILQPMQGEERLKESLFLEGLPKRPRRASRLRIAVEFLSIDRLKVKVWDLGFGELFPATDLCWEEEVELG